MILSCVGSFKLNTNRDFACRKHIHIISVIFSLIWITRSVTEKLYCEQISLRSALESEDLLSYGKVIIIATVALKTQNMYHNIYLFAKQILNIP